MCRPSGGIKAGVDGSPYPERMTADEVALMDVEAVIAAYARVIRSRHRDRAGVGLADELQKRLREWSGEAAALRREILDQVALDEGLELKELAEVAGGVSVQRAWQLRKQA